MRSSLNWERSREGGAEQETDQDETITLTKGPTEELVNGSQGGGFAFLSKISPPSNKENDRQKCKFSLH